MRQRNSEITRHNLESGIILERLRAAASTRSWRRRLLPVPSWASFRLKCADGPDQQGLCGAVGGLCQAAPGSGGAVP